MLPKMNHRVSKKNVIEIVQSMFSDYNECNRSYFPKMATMLLLFQSFPEPWHFLLREKSNSLVLDLMGHCGCLEDRNPVELMLGDTRGKV